MNSMHLIFEVTSMTNNEVADENLPDIIIDNADVVLSRKLKMFHKKVLSPDGQVIEILCS